MSERATTAVVVAVAVVLLGCCALGAASLLLGGLLLPRLAATSSTASHAWVSASTTTATQLEVGERPLVEVVNEVGDVSISAGSTGVVSVLAEVQARGRSSQAAEDLLANTTVAASATDEGVLVSVDVPDVPGSDGAVEVRLTITVPTGSRLRVQNAVGDVWAKGTHGSAELRTNVGDVGWVGPLAAGEALALATGVGNVHFTTPADSSFRLDARSTIGDVSSDFALAAADTVDPGVSGAALVGQYGDAPFADVRLRCEVGNIVLEAD